MSTNNSQGQSLKKVDLYLSKLVFSHSQLYVVISKVTSREEMKILVHDQDEDKKKVTTNVLFKEVFKNSKIKKIHHFLCIHDLSYY